VAIEWYGAVAMTSRTIVRSLILGIILGLGGLAACFSNNNGSPAGNSATDSQSTGTRSSGSSASHGGSSGSASGSSISSSAGSSGGSFSPGTLLVDNMNADAGTQIALTVPAGEKPGSYYAYSDKGSPFVTADSQLADTIFPTPITTPDGAKLTGEICFGGTVLWYAGLGMTLAYTKAADAAANALSSPTPFDASAYNGVSFYILVSPSDSGTIPTIHFGVPDTQTADPAAWPTSDCSANDAGAVPCDDDFGADLGIAPGTWTKVAFSFSANVPDALGDQALGQGVWGAQFPGGLRTNALIGMKWQANGAGPDASTSEPFNFCISNIYFTP